MLLPLSEGNGRGAAFTLPTNHMGTIDGMARYLGSRGIEVSVEHRHPFSAIKFG